MLHGLAMFDENNRLIISNRRFREIYGLPEQATARGTVLADMLLTDGRPLMRAPVINGSEPLQERSHVELPDDQAIETQFRVLAGWQLVCRHCRGQPRTRRR